MAGIRWRNTLSLGLSLLAAAGGASGIGQDSCVAFQPSMSSTFSVVSRHKAASVLVSPDEWPGVQQAAFDFVSDIQAVSGVKPTIKNVTTTQLSFSSYGSSAIIVGTLGKSSLIEAVINITNLDVSGIRGQWEAFVTKKVENPLPGIRDAYVIVGADKRGTIYALYEHSEQFGMSLDVIQITKERSSRCLCLGVSPWYW